MQQSHLPANSQFLSPGTEELNSKSPKNDGQAVNVENDWDVWLPMLPNVDELPWTLKDISKVLRLGRTRENFRAISPQAVERVSFLLQRPLLRIVREAKRLSVPYSKCSKHEMQTSIRLVLSLSMAKTCLSLASKAFSLYSMSSDRFRRSKRSRSGFILPVGRMFRWLVNMKVADRIYDAAAIYLSATLEYIAEELVFRAVNNLDFSMTDDSSSRFSCDECCSDGVDQVTPEVLEGWINTDADLWGMFQPYYHLLSGRTAFGFTDCIEMYAAPKKAVSSPKAGSPKRRGLDKCLTTTCVTSVAELTELVLQAQKRFAEVYQSKDNKLISHVYWASNALQTLYYFMKCSHQIDEEISDILAATRRAHSHLPPLVEWLRVASLHVEHRVSGMVDDHDVRQAARLLMPFNDCEPRALCPVDSLSVSRSLSSSAASISFQQDLGLRMLLCGRVDIMPQALVMLGPEKVNAINIQGMTPLMYACAEGNEALVKALIEHHVLLDTQVPNNKQIYPLVNLDLMSWTALSFAAVKGHMHVCQLLLDAGANPNGATDHGRGGQVETPLQMAAASGNYELVAMLLRKTADPYISVNTSSFSPGSRGFGNAFAAAAAHGHKNILRKLLAEPAARRENDMMSLVEILSEGSLLDGGDERKLTKIRSKALEEALYHSCEHGFLDIAMELRSLGVPWNIHCWSQTVGHAFERGQKSFLRCLLRDFQSMSADEYTNDFCDDGLVILFNIFKECEDHALLKELASVLSGCFGHGTLKEIEPLPITMASIRIGPDYINSPEMSDITFLVEGRPFYAHKIILATASKRFKAMLSNKPVKENDESNPCIEISDIKYEIFTLVIQFLYSGSVDDPGDQIQILELLQASQFFMLDSLKRHCERLAAGHLDCENVVDTYVYAKSCDAKELLTYCEGFILKNLPAMMDVKNFRDNLFDNNSQDLLQALKSCLVQRIKCHSLAKLHGKSPFKI